MKWKKHSWAIVLGVLVIIPLIIIFLANYA